MTVRKGIQKLRQNRGESLAETMAAFLIAVLGLTMLPGAIVTAARINREAERQYVRAERQSPVPETDAGGHTTVTVSLWPGAGDSDTLNVTVYRDDPDPSKNQVGESYYFYEAGADGGGGA